MMSFYNEADLFLGPIPDSINELSLLNYASFAYTYMNRMPKSMSNLTQLGYFDITGANFDGMITPDIGNCTALTDVSLFLDRTTMRNFTENSLRQIDVKIRAVSGRIYFE